MAIEKVTNKDTLESHIPRLIDSHAGNPYSVSIGGSVVEFSPATRETGVRFPANAMVLKISKGHISYT